MLDLLQDNYRFSEKLLGLLSENIGEAIMFLEDDRVSFASESCRKIFGFASRDLTGISLNALVRTLGLKQAEKYLTEKDFEVPYNDEISRDVNYVNSDGHQGISQIRIRPCLRELEINGKLIIFRDITGKIAIREERDRLHRISTLGKISAGIAHDLNHLLSVIYLENTKLLLRAKKQDYKESLEKIESAITQAQAIVARIKEFGRSSKFTFSRLDINRLIGKTLALLKTHWEAENNLRGKKININFTPGSPQEHSYVMGNIASLSTVLINLVNNAMDAIKEKGEIKISTTVHNGKAYISISDDGAGMEPEVQLNLFKPYYSTKQERGTGLGLVLAREIINEHNGTIKIMSAPEKGTTFIISLPFTTERKKERKAKVDPSSKLIFIIEDEKPVSSLLEDLFLQAGYKTIASQTRDEAIELLKEHKPGLVISDLCVPGLPFYDLANTIKSMDTNIPIILLSGYGADIDDDTRNNLGIKAIISKPFSNEGLLNTVGRILSAESN